MRMTKSPLRDGIMALIVNIPEAARLEYVLNATRGDYSLEYKHKYWEKRCEDNSPKSERASKSTLLY